MAGILSRRARLPSCRRTGVGLAMLLVTLVSLAMVVVIRELAAFWRELDHFEEFDRIRSLDRAWDSGAGLGFAGVAEKPPRWNEGRKALFPDVVQLRSWMWKEQLRLYPDGTAQCPFQQVWIYLASNTTCPPSDGQALCEDFIDAYDRVIQYYQVKKPAAGAALSFSDCDLSSLWGEWWMGGNALVNLQTMSSCTTHMPTEEEPDFRFICTTALRFIGLPLLQMPTRSLAHFPSAYKQLLSLTTHDGFMDAIEALDFQETRSPGVEISLPTERSRQQVAPEPLFSVILKAVLPKRGEATVPPSRP